MERIKQFCRWFLKEEKGNVLLLTSATTIAATFGIFFFTSIRQISLKQKERVTHLYNATIMATAINEYISTYLSTLPYPKSNLLNNGEAQFTDEELQKVTNYYNYQVLSLEDLESDGLIISRNDPTTLRVLGEHKPYDKKATKIKIEFKLDNNNKIEEIYYLVNLAGPVYEENSPYDITEPFFYLVSFNDDYDTGNYGDYDLTNNNITLTDSEANTFLSVLENNGQIAHPERTILLPGDTN